MKPIRRATALRAATAAAVALSLLSACNNGTADDVGSTRVTGGTITYGHEQEPPCLTGGWVQEAYVDRQVLDSLVAQDKGGKIVPWLAESWKVSADQKTWTFALKKGVKFTDGETFDAAAVAKNFTYWLDPKIGNPTAAAYIGEYYAGGRAVDANTFELTLSKPYSPLLSALSQGYFGLLSPENIAGAPAATCEKPVGTGPFAVEKWNHGENITFVKNPNYTSWPANAKHRGPAYVDKVVWKFLHEPTVRYGSLTTGQSDVIYDVPTVNWQD
ncbi:MAG: peptide/nickel transport system substrate-binding protein, partial [Cryptosporangiaceae bacterium]|nr:peptide/nickel transport system substrate-binding protein [Cryptosporangiaceae bacterium]